MAAAVTGSIPAPQQELLVRGLGAGAQDHRQTYARRRIVPSDARCDRRCVGDRFQLRQRAVDGFHAEFTISYHFLFSFGKGLQHAKETNEFSWYIGFEVTGGEEPPKAQEAAP